MYSSTAVFLQSIQNWLHFLTYLFSKVYSPAVSIFLQSVQFYWKSFPLLFSKVYRPVSQKIQSDFPEPLILTAFLRFLNKRNKLDDILYIIQTTQCFVLTQSFFIFFQSWPTCIHTQINGFFSCPCIYV